MKPPRLRRSRSARRGGAAAAARGQMAYYILHTACTLQTNSKWAQMTTTSEGWTAAAAVAASVQDKNREIPWCWLRRAAPRHRCTASLGRRLVRMITFLVILKKKQLSHGKLTVLSTIVWCYNVHKECQICSDQQLIQGTFGRKIMQRKSFKTLNTHRRLLSFQLGK